MEQMCDELHCGWAQSHQSYMEIYKRYLELEKDKQTSKENKASSRASSSNGTLSQQQYETGTSAFRHTCCNQKETRFPVMKEQGGESSYESNPPSDCLSET